MIVPGWDNQPVSMTGCQVFYFFYLRSFPGVVFLFPPMHDDSEYCCYDCAILLICRIWFFGLPHDVDTIMRG
jgi:hypothetical protein